MYSSLTPTVGRNSNSRVGRASLGGAVGRITSGPDGIVAGGGVRGETSTGNVPGGDTPMTSPGTWSGIGVAGVGRSGSGVERGSRSGNTGAGACGCGKPCVAGGCVSG